MSGINGSVFGLGPQGIYYVVQSAARRAGLDRIAPHDLRRTAARLSMEGGASMDQISKLLGHASVQTTERYVNSTLELREGKAAFDHIRLDEMPQDESDRLPATLHA